MHRALPVVGLAVLASAADPRVNVNGVQYEGIKEEIDAVPVEKYLGIQYATAPRFSDPVKYTPEEGKLVMAKKYGPHCMVSYYENQPANLGDSAPFESEECLFLNVFAPAGNRGGLPVVVHFYDGGFGAGTSSIFPVERMVARSGGKVITVSFNYRLSIFGFLAVPSEHRSADGATGNQGFRDQRMVLQWVHDNIRCFGGNPNRVTVMGLSAGAASISAHMVAPLSANLFHRAILQSGLAVTWGSVPLGHAEAVYHQLVAATYCGNNATYPDPVDCLRHTDVQTLSAVGRQLFYFVPNDYLGAHGPTIDGVELQEPVWESFQKGTYHDSVRAILTGGARDENALWYWPYPALAEENFDSTISPRLVDPATDLAEVKDLYTGEDYEYPSNLGQYNSWWWATVRALSDSGFWCQTQRAVKKIAERKDMKIFQYMLVHPTQQHTYCFSDFPTTPLVGHVSDVAYQFNCAAPRLTNWTVPLPMECDFQNKDEAKLAWKISGFWTEFAISGRPTKNKKRWESYDLDTDLTFMLGTRSEGGLHYKSEYRKEACDFWDTMVSKSSYP